MYNHPGEVRIARNYRCYECGAVFTTPQGICGHLHMKHDIPTEDITHTVHWGTTIARACENEPYPVACR